MKLIRRISALISTVTLISSASIASADAPMELDASRLDRITAGISIDLNTGIRQIQFVSFGRIEQDPMGNNVFIPDVVVDSCPPNCPPQPGAGTSFTFNFSTTRGSFFSGTRQRFGSIQSSIFIGRR